MLHTRLCELFGVEYPVLNAPMGGGDATARLAIAVSDAGGLGTIGGTTIGGAEWLVSQIRIARETTQRPFGVGFISHLPNTSDLMDVALRDGVRIIAHSFADPTPFVDAAHDAGAIVLCQVRTVADAHRAAIAGVDAVTAQGTEAGGHTGFVSTLPLVPAVVDAVAPVPVIAAGGIADGRGIAAALMLGAEGVWIGTRFLATHECGVSDAYKARVIESSGNNTVLTNLFDDAVGMECPEGVSGRAIRNQFVARWESRPDEFRAWVAKHRDDYRRLGPEAEIPETALWAGESAAFVTNAESAADVVTNLVATRQPYFGNERRACFAPRTLTAVSTGVPSELELRMVPRVFQMAGRPVGGTDTASVAGGSDNPSACRTRLVSHGDSPAHHNHRAVSAARAASADRAGGDAP